VSGSLGQGHGSKKAYCVCPVYGWNALIKRQSCFICVSDTSYNFLKKILVTSLLNKVYYNESFLQVAMMNQCLSQADAFFRAAIALIPSVPRLLDMDGKIRSTEPLLVDFIYNFLSTLIVVPDSPELGTLYLLRGLLNVIQDYPWDGNSDSRAMIYIKVLALLSSIVQESLPYHVIGVDSNDALYGGDPQFLADVDRIAATLLKEVGSRLRELGASSDTIPRQSRLALELFSCILTHGDMHSERVWKLAASLWTMSVQHGELDPKVVASMAQYVTSKATRLGNTTLAQLAKQMQCRFV